MDCYDINKNEWSIVGENSKFLPQKRTNSSSFVYQNYFYSYAGYLDGKILKN